MIIWRTFGVDILGLLEDQWLGSALTTGLWGLIDGDSNVSVYVATLYSNEVFYQLEVPGTDSWQAWQAKPEGMTFHEMLAWLEVVARMA